MSAAPRRAAARAGTIAAVAVVTAAVGMLAACEAQQQADRRSAAHDYTDRICRLAGDDAIITAAVYGFVGQMTPRVGLFLYIPGNDSSPPPAAVQALQDKGSTFLYSADPTPQAVVERRLAAIGDFPSLLVAYHGLVKDGAMHPAVKLSGTFVTGPTRGTSTGVRAVAPVCDSTGAWQPPARTTKPGAE